MGDALCRVPTSTSRTERHAQRGLTLVLWVAALSTTWAPVGAAPPALEDATLEQVAQAEREGNRAQIERWLRAGQSDAVTDRALEALSALAAPASLPLLAEFTRHRRPAARLRAHVALSKLADPRAEPLVRQGLRDPSARVRGAAAAALGRMDAVDSVPVLLLALQRGVPEAAAAVGKLGDARTVARLDALVGEVPIQHLLAGYRAYLQREDLPLAVRRGIVATLEEVAGPAVASFLQQQVDTLEAPPPLRADLARALRRVRAGEDERK